jgi:cell division septum initiation protein DivIVA
VTDNRMKDRVKVMLSGPSADSETSEHVLIAPPNNQPHPNAPHPNQALQVLTMAQRTAEEHVTTAHRQADKIHTDALAAAEEIARDAQVHAHNVRREADKVLFEARASAEQTAREQQARAEEAQRQAEKIVVDARSQADAIAASARANADQLRAQAKQRFDDVVGSLGTKREGLQQQIEALEHFDREYRSRLTSFMQNQMRALWVDQPQVAGDLEPADVDITPQVSPAEPDDVDEEQVEQDGRDQRTDARIQVPAQRHEDLTAEHPLAGAHAAGDE